ncbi:hypothetical protein [Dasania marina]|uniref:hypothetical protein n=1 Tax=Dasania marina TaxID=471499 RepID=UPI0030D70312|tara:strand:+ start:2642 stop:2815 length:174 start_codon:yes stop_codon:yes gene_type:complete
MSSKFIALEILSLTIDHSKLAIYTVLIIPEAVTRMMSIATHAHTAMAQVMSKAPWSA